MESTTILFFNLKITTRVAVVGKFKILTYFISYLFVFNSKHIDRVEPLYICRINAFRKLPLATFIILCVRTSKKYSLKTRPVFLKKVMAYLENIIRAEVVMAYCLHYTYNFHNLWIIKSNLRTHIGVLIVNYIGTLLNCSGIYVARL